MSNDTLAWILFGAFFLFLFLAPFISMMRDSKGPGAPDYEDFDEDSIDDEADSDPD